MVTVIKKKIYRRVYHPRGLNEKNKNNLMNQSMIEMKIMQGLIILLKKLRMSN